MTLYHSSITLCSLWYGFRYFRIPQFQAMRGSDKIDMIEIDSTRMVKPQYWAKASQRTLRNVTPYNRSTWESDW